MRPRSQALAAADMRSRQVARKEEDHNEVQPCGGQDQAVDLDARLLF